MQTCDCRVEESLLRFSNLRLLPLLDVVLVDLEVDPLHLVGRLDLDTAEEGLKVVKNSSGYNYFKYTF